jgi:cysteine desulfurase / selenocysteine lyase
MIYLDHAATSWPKPAEVVCAVREFLECSSGNPGRSGHSLSIEAGRIVYETRETVADFFNAPDSMRVIFMHNATYAINTAVSGLLEPGDTVVTTSIEHNAVMRPLRALERQGVRVITVACDACGGLDQAAYKRVLAQGARLVVLNHASNVIGNLMPIEELAKTAHRYGALVLVDSAQSAGVVPLDMQAMNIDLLAFTGHKGLQGPQGTGGLIIGPGVDPEELRPLVYGGTGSSSGSEDQPEVLPDKYESGTSNGPGIAGLMAGIQWISAKTLDTISAHHDRLVVRLMGGLAEIPGVKTYGPEAGVKRAPLVSFNVEGRSASEVGMRLDDEFGVQCRVGLHCAPAAHRTMGTFPDGAVRFSIGPMTAESEVESAVSAVARLARR